MRHDKVQKSIAAYMCRYSSHMPAWLDLLQSLSGLLLSVFVAVHLLLEGSIIIGADAMLAVTRFFEGYYFFDQPYPGIVAFLAALIFVLFIAHALLAMRKLSSTYRQYIVFKRHMSQFAHADTNLWFYQAVTGVMMFFLGSIHLYQMLSQPADIGPYLSSDRVYSEWQWPMYLVLLVSVVVHAAIGCYRLALKWGFFEGRNTRLSRQRMKKWMSGAILVYLLIGLLSLLSYLLIGYGHRDRQGESYQPQPLQHKPMTKVLPKL